jgi:hypothetical protein
MGINSRVFDLLATHCRREDKDGRALIAGYPDMVVDIETLKKHITQPLALRVDSKQSEIQRMHGWDRPVPDAHDVFRELGYRLTIIDIHAEHGEEEIVDLNRDGRGHKALWIDESLHGGGGWKRFVRRYYDLVVDHGTIEHCFNIGQAALTLISAVPVNGWMVQHLPFSMANHGFYNINPTWFFDLYEANGFEIIHFEAVHRDETFEMPRHERFRGAPEDSLCTMIARRVKAIPPTMPIQRRYQR